MEKGITDINSFKELIREMANKKQFRLDEIQIHINERLTKILYNDIDWNIEKSDGLYKQLLSVYTYGNITMGNTVIKILSTHRLFGDVDLIILPITNHKDQIYIRLKDKPASSTTIESCKG